VTGWTSISFSRRILLHVVYLVKAVW